MLLAGWMNHKRQGVILSIGIGHLQPKVTGDRLSIFRAELKLPPCRHLNLAWRYGKPCEARQLLGTCIDTGDDRSIGSAHVGHASLKGERKPTSLRIGGEWLVANLRLSSVDQTEALPRPA